jgi:hypothetical protein
MSRETRSEPGVLEQGEGVVERRIWHWFECVSDRVVAVQAPTRAIR